MLHIATSQILRTSGVSLHPDVAAWQSRVVAAGGTLSTTTLNATDILVKWCYANGLRDSVGTNHKITFWLPLVTDTFSGLFIPLWHPTSTSALTQTGVVSANYTRTAGLAGNGSSWIDSGVVISNNVCMIADVRTNSVANDTAIGVYDTTDIEMNPKWTDTNTYGVYGNPASNYVSFVSANAIGLHVWNASGGSQQYFIEGASLATSSFSAPTAPSLTVGLMALRGGTINQYSTRTYQSFLLGTNLSSTEIQSLTTQYQSWRTAVRG